MAQGDITVFNDALINLTADTTWDPSDEIYIAVITNATNPTASDSSPELGDYTEVNTGGTYTAGGELLDTLETMLTSTGGVIKFDSDSEPEWLLNVSNSSNAYWGIIYNADQSGNPCIAFIDMSGPVDMTASDVSFVFNPSGIFTITRV